jgi:hypothetical protein
VRPQGAVGASIVTVANGCPRLIRSAADVAVLACQQGLLRDRSGRPSGDDGERRDRGERDDGGLPAMSCHGSSNDRFDPRTRRSRASALATRQSSGLGQLGYGYATIWIVRAKPGGAIAFAQ